MVIMSNKVNFLLLLHLKAKKLGHVSACLQSAKGEARRAIEETLTEY